MLTLFFQRTRTIAAATACAVACCQSLWAAEPAISFDAYSPLLAQPANQSELRVAQVAPSPGVAPVPSAAPIPGVAPTPGVAPVQSAAPVPNVQPSAQPGQSTIPSPSSSPGTPPSIQGAQPGQSTVPSPTFTPFNTAPNSADGFQQVAPGSVQSGAQPVIAAPRVPVAVPVPLPPQEGIPPQDPIVVEPSTVIGVPAQPSLGPTGPRSTFVDDENSMPVLEEKNGEFVVRRGVHPYGGGHPTDWWGCNGSPYRTGPGMCDDYRVGPRWHVTVDGIVMSRDNADLAQIHDYMPTSFPPLPSVPYSNPGTTGNGIGGPPGFTDPTFENFEYEGGARITFTSQIAQVTGWDLQIAYAGIPEWNSSIVYPKLSFEIDAPPDPPGGFPLNPVPIPPDPFPEGSIQRSLHYRSTLHSLEMNALTGNRTWRPLFGARYFRFSDEINDFIDNESQPPLAGPRPDTNPIGPSYETDRLNLFDIQNNLIGFQVGLLHDTWQVNRRFAVEGRVTGGVYYNRIKYTNIMGTYTTQIYADNTATPAVNEARIDTSSVVNNDLREYSEIAYHGEASLTGVCRLNRCWALRGGYQVLWLGNVHTAQDAYLGQENVNDNLLFHGWHAGIECRR